MKKIIAVVAVAAAMFAAGAASAAPLDFLKGNYVEGSLGTDFVNDRHTSPNFSVAIGKDLGMVRGELAYSGTRDANTNVKLGDVGTNLISANLYVQPVVIYGVTPYVEGGVGYGQVYNGGVVGRRDGVVFNVGVGASYPLTSDIDMVVGYRHYVAEDVKIRQTVALTEQYRSDAVTVGLRYTF